MAILSIDPGVTTGIAIAPDNIDANFFTCVTTEKEQVWDFVMGEAVEVVVIERFATSDYLSKYGLHTIEIVGGVKALCYRHRIRLVIHQPQNRKSMQDLAHKHLIKQGQEYMIHEEDALAHLMYYLETGR